MGKLSLIGRSDAEADQNEAGGFPPAHLYGNINNAGLPLISCIGQIRPRHRP